MKVPRSLAAALLVLLSPVADAEATEESAAASRWDLDAAALLLRRDRGGTVVFAQEFSASTGDLIGRRSTNDLRYGLEPGARLGLTYRFRDDWAAGITYFGLDEWDESTALVNSNPAGPNTLLSPVLIGTPAEFSTFTRSIGAQMQSELHSLEFALRKDVAPDTRIGAALRYVRFDDDLRIRADGEAGFDRRFDESTVEARNELLGGQVGIEHTFRSRRLSVEISGNVGLLHNWNDQEISEVAGTPGAGADVRYAFVSGDGTRATGLLEFGVTARYRVHRNVQLSAGYQLMSLHGLALAPEQLDFVRDDAGLAIPVVNASAGTRDSNDLIFQGVHVGLRLDW